MPVLHVYSRQGCHLCDVLIEALLPMVRGVFTIEVRDIDSRPDWRKIYDVRVPVVEFDGRIVCQYKLDRSAIADLLAAASGAGDE